MAAVSDFPTVASLFAFLESEHVYALRPEGKIQEIVQTSTSHIAAVLVRGRERFVLPNGDEEIELFNDYMEAMQTTIRLHRAVLQRKLKECDADLKKLDDLKTTMVNDPSPEYFADEDTLRNSLKYMGVKELKGLLRSLDLTAHDVSDKERLLTLIADAAVRKFGDEDTYSKLKKWWADFRPVFYSVTPRFQKGNVPSEPGLRPEDTAAIEGVVKDNTPAGFSVDGFEVPITRDYDPEVD